MTDTAPQALAEIAGKLSEAQREAICDCDEHGGKWWLPFSRGVGRDLYVARLVDTNLAWYWLNAAGLALRSYLMSNSEGKE